MVSAPPTPNTAPPGYYMLFIMHGDVPSVASIIQVAMVPPSMSVNDISLTEPRPRHDRERHLHREHSAGSRSHDYGQLFDRRRDGERREELCRRKPEYSRLLPGVTSQTVTVPVIGDGVTDPNETFTLNLSSPVGATLGKAARHAR